MCLVKGQPRQPIQGLEQQKAAAYINWIKVPRFQPTMGSILQLASWSSGMIPASGKHLKSPILQNRLCRRPRVRIPVKPHLFFSFFLIFALLFANFDFI